MPTDIRITDPHTIELVEAVRESRRDKTSAKTARDLIRERVTSLEERQIKSGSEEVQAGNGSNAASTAA